jgi:hypothetical protein
MSAKYLKQWDLPCYPNDKPLPGSRNIIGIGKTENAGVLQLWMGGCGIGKYHTRSLPRAVEHLHEEVRQRLEARVAESQKELEHAQRLLLDWTEFPEQFAVKPEGD